MINDTIGLNQPLMLELLLLRQSLKSRWGRCPPAPAAPLGLAGGFTGQTVGTWLTKEGSKERDTLLTPHTKALQGLGWGWFVCLFPKLLLHYSYVQEQLKNFCNSSLQCSCTIFDGVLMTSVLLDPHFYMLLLYSAGWKSEVLSYAGQLLESVIWSILAVQ